MINCGSGIMAAASGAVAVTFNSATASGSTISTDKLSMGCGNNSASPRGQAESTTTVQVGSSQSGTASFSMQLLYVGARAEVGFAATGYTLGSGNELYLAGNCYVLRYNNNNNRLDFGNSSTLTWTNQTGSINDVYKFDLDKNSGVVTWYQNGTSRGTLCTLPAGTYYFATCATAYVASFGYTWTLTAQTWA